ncbi:MAG: hypothetical protein AAB675_02090 [Patescibacteria group bacterium]
MVKRKSTCGLCKPTKKWKRSDTKQKQIMKQNIEEEIFVLK